MIGVDVTGVRVIKRSTGGSSPDPIETNNSSLLFFISKNSCDSTSRRSSRDFNISFSIRLWAFNNSSDDLVVVGGWVLLNS